MVIFSFRELGLHPQPIVPFQVENNHQGMGTVYPSRREGGFSAVGQTYVITQLRRQYIYAYAELRLSVYARNDTCPKVE